MKTVIYTSCGPPEVLQIREVDKPTPKNDEVLINIKATSVTIGDVLLRGFKFPFNVIFNLVFGLGKNKIPGHELAGVIEAKGKDVSRFKIGDQIFASTDTKGGANSEYICLSENGMLALKPSNLTYEEAAVIPVGANTALDILRKIEIHSGQKVLIYGASGSVGTYAVQLARHFGAKVTGVCSSTNLAMVKSLGAEKVFDYTKEDFSKSGQEYDVIFDAVKKISSSQCKSALNENGVFLSVSSPTKEKYENLVFLKELIEDGKLRPVIDRQYPLEEIVKAHRYVETGHKKGNVVITL